MLFRSGSQDLDDDPLRPDRLPFPVAAFFESSIAAVLSLPMARAPAVAVERRERKQRRSEEAEAEEERLGAQCPRFGLGAFL